MTDLELFYNAFVLLQRSFGILRFDDGPIHRLYRCLNMLVSKQESELLLHRP